MGNGAIKVRISTPEYEGRMWMKPKNGRKEEGRVSKLHSNSIQEREVEYPSRMYYETMHASVLVFSIESISCKSVGRDGLCPWNLLKLTQKNLVLDRKPLLVHYYMLTFLCYDKEEVLSDTCWKEKILPHWFIAVDGNNV